MPADGADPAAAVTAAVAIAFEGEVIEWREPAPFYFVRIAEEVLGEVHWAARTASYGWGCMPVAAQVACPSPPR